MAKQVVETFRMQVPAGQATPGPPVGVALGPRNVNPGAFCKEFNDRTQTLQGVTVTVEMRIYRDRSFDFDVLGPTTADMLKQAANIVVGSGEPNREKVARISEDQLEEIARQKMEHLNTNDLDGAVKQIEGTARSMGIEIGEGPLDAGAEEGEEPEEDTE